MCEFDLDYEFDDINFDSEIESMSDIDDESELINGEIDDDYLDLNDEVDSLELPSDIEFNELEPNAEEYGQDIETLFLDSENINENSFNETDDFIEAEEMTDDLEAISESVEEFNDIEQFVDNSTDIEELQELRDALTSSNNEEISENFDDLENFEESLIDAETETNEIDFNDLSADELDENEYGLNSELPILEETEENIEDINEYDEESDVKTLTRELTPEMVDSFNRDTELTLDGYRDNLRDYNVPEEKIDEFIEQEREKMNNEFYGLMNIGTQDDLSSYTYYPITDWEEMANSLINENQNDVFEEMQEEINFESSDSDFNELDVDYESIYNDIDNDFLNESFADIKIDQDPERLDSSLEDFDQNIWNDLSLNEQKETIENLSDYVKDVIGFKNEPKIVYYYNEKEGDYGGFDPSTNTLNINEYMLYDSKEAADTVAHELWHAHQHERSSNPQNSRDYQYRYNFDNYIRPEFGQKEYQSQLIEEEARAFASQLKDRLSEIKGR